MRAPRRILFVTYGGGHVNMVIPVARQLAASAEYDVRILALTTAGGVLEKAGIPHLGVRDFVGPGDGPALSIGHALAQQLTPGAVTADESAAYLGLCYLDLEVRLGKNEAARQYALAGRQAFLPLTLMDRIFGEIRPDLVVATNSPRAERAAIETACARGVPALCMVDLFCIQEVKWVGKPGYADRVCVLSEEVRSMLIAAGRRGEDVVVTGNPAFDYLASPALGVAGMDHRRARGWEQDRLILWAVQPEPPHHPTAPGRRGDTQLPERIEAALVNVVQRHDSWRLIIRDHPAWQRPERSYAGKVEIDNGTQLGILLAAVDVVVTMTSTVGIEAALIGKPVVVPQLSILADSAPYVELGMARGAESLDDMELALADVLESRWVPTWSGMRCGTAAERVVRVIEDMLD